MASFQSYPGARKWVLLLEVVGWPKQNGNYRGYRGEIGYILGFIYGVYIGLFQKIESMYVSRSFST